MIRIDLPEDTTQRLLERRHVTAEGCWEWTRSRRNGYGRVWIGAKVHSVHRLAAHLWLDFDLDSPLMICHRCDNPPCFNPDHLFPGTAFDNMRDASNKGRFSGPRTPRQTTYPRIRSCAACGTYYEPDPDHRGRSVVCSQACRIAWLSVARRGKGTKVTPEAVEVMRGMVEAGWSYRDAGQMFGVTASCAHKRINGRSAA